MKYARGDFVQFLDSDDMLEVGALDRLYQVSNEQNLDILFFNAKTIYDDEGLKQSFPQFKSTYVTKADLSQPRRGLDLLAGMQQHGEYRVPVWLKFYKRSFLLENEITFEEHILHEDNLFTFHCLCKANRVSRINEGWYCRRIRRNSIMTTPIKFENVYGYLRCYLGVLRQILSLDVVSEEHEYSMKSIAESLARAVISNYEMLDTNEQKRIASLTPMEQHIFAQLNCRFQKKTKTKDLQPKDPIQKDAVKNTVVKKEPARKPGEIKNNKKPAKRPPQSKNLLKVTWSCYKANGFTSTVLKIFDYLKH